MALSVALRTNSAAEILSLSAVFLTSSHSESENRTPLWVRKSGCEAVEFLAVSGPVGSLVVMIVFFR